MEHFLTEEGKRSTLELAIEPYSIEIDGAEAHYDVKLRATDEAAAVLFIEREGNTRKTVVNASERLATEIVGKFFLRPEATRFFEHYEENVAEVTYDWEGKVASNPQWKPADVEEVEGLFGSKE